MRKESKILSVLVDLGPKDPMVDDHWETSEDQVDALKKLVEELKQNQKKPRKKKTSE